MRMDVGNNAYMRFLEIDAWLKSVDFLECKIVKELSYGEISCS